MRKIGTSGAKRFLRARDVSGLTAACHKLDADLEGVMSIQQLLGVEGQFSKACYAEFARLSGLSKKTPFRRDAGSQGKPDLADPIKRVNHLIDHGNYLCYGIAGAALWALGIPPHMSIFHGKTRAGGLVFDLADGFKDALVLPRAFASKISSRDESPENIFRARMIDAFDDHQTLKGAVETVNRMIAVGLPKESADHA